jgi:hypothetical protein
MADEQYDKLNLVGRHVPDENGGPFNTMAEANARGHDSLNPTTGYYQIGVVLDGGFVPIYEDHASHFYAVRDASKKANESKDEPANSG